MEKESNIQDIISAIGLLEEEIIKYKDNKINSAKNKIINIPTYLKDSYLTFKEDVVIYKYETLKEQLERKIITMKRKQDMKIALKKDEIKDKFIAKKEDIIEFTDIVKVNYENSKIVNVSKDNLHKLKNSIPCLIIQKEYLKKKKKISDYLEEVKTEIKVEEVNKALVNGDIQSINTNITSRSILGKISKNALSRLKNNIYSKSNEIKNNAETVFKSQIKQPLQNIYEEQKEKNEIKREQLKNDIYNIQRQMEVNSNVAVGEDIFKDQASVLQKQK